MPGGAAVSRILARFCNSVELPDGNLFVGRPPNMMGRPTRPVRRSRDSQLLRLSARLQTDDKSSCNRSAVMPQSSAGRTEDAVVLSLIPAASHANVMTTGGRRQNHVQPESTHHRWVSISAAEQSAARSLVISSVATVVVFDGSGRMPAADAAAGRWHCPRHPSAIFPVGTRTGPESPVTLWDRAFG